MPVSQDKNSRRIKSSIVLIYKTLNKQLPWNWFINWRNIWVQSEHKYFFNFTPFSILVQQLLWRLFKKEKSNSSVVLGEAVIIRNNRRLFLHSKIPSSVNFLHSCGPTSVEQEALQLLVTMIMFLYHSSLRKYQHRINIATKWLFVMSALKNPRH